MSVIGSNILAGASGQGGGYNLTRSLRFRSSASAYLNRTPASASNQKTWTFSAWLKRGQLTSDQTIFQAGNTFIRFGNGSADTLWLNLRGASTNYFFQTAQVFRDSSSWYHLVIAVDTTQATSTNRVKIYVNGVQVTNFNTYSDYPPQNTDTAINSAVAHNIGYFGGYGAYLDGYLAEANFIDGQALTPSSFGETSATTGVWQPKRYAGTYGTNGFYLPFTDVATTSGSNAGLGKDFSGNGNYWTTNNISVTTGATYDSMTDVPTLTSATASNFAVMNPLDKSSNVSITNGNLTTAWGGSTIANIRGTFELPTTGKYYWEALFSGTSQGSVGVAAANMPLGSVASGTYISYAESGLKYVNGSSSGYGSTYGSGDLIGIAYDADSAQITFYKNNTSQGAISLTANTTYFPLAVHYNTTINFNFGQRPFAYTPPTGFVALNTFNLPTPTIGATASSQANKYFDIATYNNATVVSGLGFAPDFVWHKSRNQAYSHYLYDKLRGVGAKGLNSNSTASEGTNDALGIVSFDSTGVTYSSDAGLSQTNAVGWFWKANGTGVTNTAGSITSTVSANTSSGFSIVTYTGTGSTGTVGHGLGVAPKMIIVKNRSSALDWRVYVETLGNGNALSLNTTGASGATSNWNNTSPTSTVFSLGTASGVNGSGNSLVAYCFSEVAGYSKFSSYAGTGSTNFIYTGFKPKFIMIKVTTSAGRWEMFDISRSPYNPSNSRLAANESSAEVTNYASPDFLSNGFKLNSAVGYTNDSGQTYLYMAFAENPFKYSLAQ